MPSIATPDNLSEIQRQLDDETPEVLTQTRPLEVAKTHEQARQAAIARNAFIEGVTSDSAQLARAAALLPPTTEAVYRAMIASSYICPAAFAPLTLIDIDHPLSGTRGVYEGGTMDIVDGERCDPAGLLAEQALASLTNKQRVVMVSKSLSSYKLRHVAPDFVVEERARIAKPNVAVSQERKDLVALYDNGVAVAAWAAVEKITQAHAMATESDAAHGVEMAGLLKSLAMSGVSEERALRVGLAEVVSASPTLMLRYFLSADVQNTPSYRQTHSPLAGKGKAHMARRSAADKILKDALMQHPGAALSILRDVIMTVPRAGRNDAPTPTSRYEPFLFSGYGASMSRHEKAMVSCGHIWSDRYSPQLLRSPMIKGGTSRARVRSTAHNDMIDALHFDNPWGERAMGASAFAAEKAFICFVGMMRQLGMRDVLALPGRKKGVRCLWTSEPTIGDEGSAMTGAPVVHRLNACIQHELRDGRYEHAAILGDAIVHATDQNKPCTTAAQRVWRSYKMGTPTARLDEDGLPSMFTPAMTRDLQELGTYHDWNALLRTCLQAGAVHARRLSRPEHLT